MSFTLKMTGRDSTISILQGWIPRPWICVGLVLKLGALWPESNRRASSSCIVICGVVKLGGEILCPGHLEHAWGVQHQKPYAEHVCVLLACLFVFYLVSLKGRVEYISSTASLSSAHDSLNEARSKPGARSCI